MAARGSNRSIEQWPLFDLRPRGAEPALRLSLFIFDGHCSPSGHQARRGSRLSTAMRRGRVRTRAGCFWLESRFGFPNQLRSDSTCWLGGGQQGMPKPYSQDLRDRVIDAVERGEM